MAKVVMEPDKLVKSAKGIQRIVREKLAERLRHEESKAEEDFENEKSESREKVTQNHTPPIDEK